MNAWFGHGMRDTAIADGWPEIPVPDGELCYYCGTMIIEWDSGERIPLIGSLGTVKMLYRHQECVIYSVQGSRWCRAEGVEMKSPQHERYHALQRAAYGIMRPRAIERRVLLEFGEFISEDELINNWRAVHDGR